MEEKFVRTSLNGIILVANGLIFMFSGVLKLGLLQDLGYASIVIGVLSIIIGIWNFRTPYIILNNENLKILFSPFKSREIPIKNIKTIEKHGKGLIIQGVGLYGDKWTYMLRLGQMVSDQRQDFTDLLKKMSNC